MSQIEALDAIERYLVDLMTAARELGNSSRDILVLKESCLGFCNSASTLVRRARTHCRTYSFPFDPPRDDDEAI